MGSCAEFTRLLYDETVQIASVLDGSIANAVLFVPTCLRVSDPWESERRFLVLFTDLPSTAFAKCGQVFSKIILGVFGVWKKVLVIRRAVNRSVCLLTYEISGTLDSSECRQLFISVSLTIQTCLFW